MEPKKNTEVKPEESAAQIPSEAPCYIINQESQDWTWDFMRKEWFELIGDPTCKLTPVPYNKGSFHDFLEGEELTLMKGDDDMYYTKITVTQPYGDYATTEADIYGAFRRPKMVESALSI